MGIVMSSAKISPKTAQQLLSAIEHDLKLAQQLKKLLQEERTFLERRQFSAHQELVKTKTQYLMELEKADGERQQAMANMGLSHNKAGLNEFVGKIPATWKQRFMASWEKLSDTMNTCARLNKVNGKILAHSQNSMERLMTIIKGNGNNVSVYQSNGRRNLNAANRMLATA